MAVADAELEPGMVRIIRLRSTIQPEDDPREPIKLLTVNESTIGIGALPLFFGPDEKPPYNFASAVLEVTPDEYDQILAGQLALPHGWTLAETIFERAAVAVAD